MSIATQQEIVSHAVAGEEIRAPRDRRERLLREGRKKLQEGTFAEAISAMQSESPLESRRLHEITLSFGTKIIVGGSEDGKVKVDENVDPAIGKSEKVLQEDTRVEIELLQKLTERGFNEISTDEQGKIREIVKKRLLSNSAISKDLSQRQTNGTLDSYLDELIQNPAFNPRLKEIVNGYARTNDLDTTFIDAYEQYRNSEADATAATEKAAQAKIKADRLRAQAAAYEKDPTTQAEGEFYKKMTETQAQGAQPQEEIPLIEAGINDLKDRLRRTERELSEGPTSAGATPLTLAELKSDIEKEQSDIDYWNGKIRAEETAAADDSRQPRDKLIEGWRAHVKSATDRRDRAQGRLRGVEAQQPEIINRQEIYNRIDGLTEEIRKQEELLAKKRAATQDVTNYRAQYEALRQQEDQALKELAEANADKTKSENAKIRAKQNYDRAVNLRKAQQQTLAEKLSGSYGEAAHRVIVDQMIRANNESKTLHDEFQKEAISNAETGLLNYLATDRWHFPERTERRGILGFRRTVTYRPTDRGAINDDWRMLLDQGEDVMLKAMLASTTNPDTGNLYTADQITDIYKDPETVARMKEFAVKNLTLKRIQNGGMTIEDIDVMTQKALGKNVDAAIAQRTDVRQQIEELLGAGAFERHDFKSRLAQVIRKNPWLLLSLLAFPAALAMGPVTLPVALGGATLGSATIGAGAAALGPGAAGVMAKQMKPQDEQLHASG